MLYEVITDMFGEIVSQGAQGVLREGQDGMSCNDPDCSAVRSPHSQPYPIRCFLMDSRQPMAPIQRHGGRRTGKAFDDAGDQHFHSLFYCDQRIARVQASYNFV